MMIRKILGTLLSYNEGENEPTDLTKESVESFVRGVKEYQVLRPLEGIATDGIISTVEGSRYAINYIFNYLDLEVEVSCIFNDPECAEDKLSFYVSVHDDRLPVFFIYTMTSETDIESFHSEIGSRITDEDEMWSFTEDGELIDCSYLRGIIMSMSHSIVSPVLSALKELRSGGVYV